MLKHYFLVSWRNIVRNKFYTLLLIGGFAVGLASSILLLMFAWDELTYDNFHEKKDRIFLVGVNQKEGESEELSGWTTPPTGPALQEFLPEVETYTRLCFWFDEVLVNQGEQQFFSECRVTGVVKDYPENSQFRFNILLSLKTFEKINFDFNSSWGNHTFSTYLLLNQNSNKQVVEAKLPAFIKAHFEPYLLTQYNMSYERFIRRMEATINCFWNL